MASPAVPTWLRTRRAFGVSAQVVTVGFAVALAALGNTKHPPSAAVNAVIVLLVVAAQLGAAWAFSTEGKADPSLAERSVGRLYHLATRTQEAEKRAQGAFEASTKSNDLHAEMGVLSTEFSWIGDGLVQAIDDWRMFHPKAVDRAKGTDDGV